MSTQIFKTMVLPTQKTVSMIATAIIVLALIVLLTHYVAAMFQPVRWPTRYYFLGMFLIALCLKQRTAIMLFVFSLPILPDFHLQLEAVLRPPVKYFVALPDLDVVAGLCLGLWIKRMWLTKKIEPVFERVNWVLGLLVIAIAVSTSIAVVRNFQAAPVLGINVLELLRQLVQFKLINYPNNYLPIVDLLSYSFAILVICTLVPILKPLDLKQREEIIFWPLIVGIALSALWGILQAFTGLGLFQVTLTYRPASFGFGAQGFQPDLHAFAAIMLIGTVGILEFLRKAQGRNLLLGYGCVALCWLALILCKSKASFVFATVASLAFMIASLRSKGIALKKIIYVSLAALLGLGLLLLITRNFVWMERVAELLSPDNLSRQNFNTAFVHRPELFRAALYMFSEYPLFGIGQGNLFRMSSHIDVSHSIYMVQQGGENAHNYFLQTLAETGLVGTAAFILVLSWPFCRVAQFSKIAAPALALFSIGLGNLFSHPLLIRPNLILFAVLLALMYASIDNNLSRNARPTTT
jgi:O-antigen ligase